METQRWKGLSSESGKSVTQERVRLTEAYVDGIQATNDGLKPFSSPASVPVTKKFLQMGRAKKKKKKKNGPCSPFLLPIKTGERERGTQKQAESSG